MFKSSEKVRPEVWDVAVVGGGPAGMMAAGRAAERGARVILLEKNPGLGKKLLITGGGRCNLTNAELDNRRLLARFKADGKFLFSAFAEWSVKETLAFFAGRGLATKVENEGRVFPITNKAESVWRVLVDYLRQTKVTILTGAEVTGFEVKGKTITGLKLKTKKVIKARSFILATGGQSHPETGSTGEGFKWLAKLGHTINPPTASLVPLRSSAAWVKRLQGVTLANIKLTLLQDGGKPAAKLGKILFTHFGVSGPTILNLSQSVSERLKWGPVTLLLDLLPTWPLDALNLHLQSIFREHSNKKFKNSLGELIPPALVPAVVELSGIDSEKGSHSVTRPERLALAKLLKGLPLPISGLLGAEKAIITAGGVKLEEVQFKTMASRLYPNLYLVGDVLDIERPSGGYSLQLCWTTGFVAGNSLPLA